MVDYMQKFLLINFFNIKLIERLILLIFTVV